MSRESVTPAPATQPTPSQALFLVDLARSILTQPLMGAGTTGPAAAALLARQALETGLAQWWAQRLPGMGSASVRAQLISLAFYLPSAGTAVRAQRLPEPGPDVVRVGDHTLAADVVWAWNRLSALCHHRAFGVPPSQGEVEALLDVVERLNGLTSS